LTQIYQNKDMDDDEVSSLFNLSLD
jgi:hypothetical protein